MYQCPIQGDSTAHRRRHECDVSIAGLRIAKGLDNFVDQSLCEPAAPALELRQRDSLDTSDSRTC